MRNHFRTRTLNKIVTENAPLPASALVESESQARAEPRKKIHLASPIIDAEMKAAALAALENEMMVMGESVFKFEEEFAKYCGTKYAVSTASGTAALNYVSSPEYRAWQRSHHDPLLLHRNSKLNCSCRSGSHFR